MQINIYVDVPRGTTWIFHGARLIKTIQLLIQICLLGTLVLVTGCKSEDREPHLRDPIYSDIQKEMLAAESEASAQQIKAEKAEADYNKAEIRSIDRKTSKNEMEKAKNAHQKAAQMAEYYKIKLKLREAEAKIAYKRAFTAGEDWPDPKEYESYQLQKKFRQTSRNWRDRLPKSGEPSLPSPMGEGGAVEAGGGH